MHQLQSIKSKKSSQPGGRRDARPLLAPVFQHDRWMELQRGIGNQAVSRMLRKRAAPGAIQTKLTIHEPGDRYEQEADRVAEQVARTPEPQIQRACSCGGGCPKCRAEQLPGKEHESLQTKRAYGSDTDQIAAPAIVHEILRSPGQPLDSSTRTFMEARFGYDFSQVRVHTGAAAEKSARDVNAHAYTAGHHVVFGASRFAPETQAGRRLIAHELTHVVQQSGMDTAHAGQNDHQRGQSILHVLPHLQPSFLRSGMTLQRQAERPDIRPIPALAPLEVVAQEAAKLVLKNYAADQISAGPVLTAVLDTRTGKIYIGLNSGIPPEVADVVANAIAAQRERIEKREVLVVHTDPLAQGGHSETNAVNEAVRAREALLKRKVTEEDLRTFELHNVWLRGADRRRFTADPRCEHCARITRSVSVTSPVFFAEGGVSGTIKTPTGGYRAPRVGPGGPTGTISGTIDPNKPRTSPGSGAGTLPPVKPFATAVHSEITTGGAVPPKPTGETLHVEATPPARVSGGFARGMVGSGVTAIAQMAISYLLGWLLGDPNESRIKADAARLEPEIVAAINRLQGKTEKLLVQPKKRIYANITVDIVYCQTIDPEGPPNYDYYDTRLNHVEVSHENVEESHIYRETVVLDNYDHHLFTYSVPIAEPAALVLPTIRSIHDEVAAITTGLMAISHRTAGESVAIDKLKIAEQATDYTGPTAFQDNAERFHLTWKAVNDSLGFLSSSENPITQRLFNRLAIVKFRVEGIGTGWTLMVE